MTATIVPGSMTPTAGTDTFASTLSMATAVPGRNPVNSAATHDSPPTHYHIVGIPLYTRPPRTTARTRIRRSSGCPVTSCRRRSSRTQDRARQSRPASGNRPASTRSPCSPPCTFFFQAEDGIRDKLVTGVQTCALPIFEPSAITVGAVDTRGTNTRIDDAIASYSSRGPSRSFWTDESGVKHYDNQLKPELAAPDRKSTRLNSSH